MEYAAIVAIDTMHGHPLRCIPQAQAIERCVQRRRIDADRSAAEYRYCSALYGPLTGTST
jgi:hypothetical protein